MVPCMGGVISKKSYSLLVKLFMEVPMEYNDYNKPDEMTFRNSKKRKI